MAPVNPLIPQLACLFVFHHDWYVIISSVNQACILNESLVLELLQNGFEYEKRRRGRSSL